MQQRNNDLWPLLVRRCGAVIWVVVGVVATVFVVEEGERIGIVKL